MSERDVLTITMNGNEGLYECVRSGLVVWLGNCELVVCLVLWGGLLPVQPRGGMNLNMRGRI